MKKEIPSVLKNPTLIENPAPKTTLLVGGSLENVQISYKEDLEQKKIELEKIFAQKFMALIEFSELDPTSPDFSKDLSSFLLTNPINGFLVDEKKKEGPIKKWNFLEQIRLWFEVEELMAVKEFNISDACRALLKKEHWKNLVHSRSGNDLSNSLLKQYIFAKKTPIVKAFCDIRDRYPDKDSPERKNIDDIIRDFYTQTFSDGNILKKVRK